MLVELVLRIEGLGASLATATPYLQGFAVKEASVWATVKYS